MSNKQTQIETVAAEAVQRSGLNNLSFRTIAQDVGVKSASVHYYFPEKSDLAEKLIENYTEEFSRALENIDSTKRGLKGKLDGFIQIFEDVLRDGKLCLCGMLAAELEQLNEQSRQLLGRFFGLAETWLLNTLKHDSDQLSVAIKPEKLAMIVMSGLEGAILLDRVNGNTDRLRAQRELIRGFLK